jgi:hypothetical protein
LTKLEDKIDHTYINPNASIDQLKVFLRDYWTFHMEDKREFKQAEQLNLDLHLAETRKAMTEERIRA